MTLTDHNARCSSPLHTVDRSAPVSDMMTGRRYVTLRNACVYGHSVFSTVDLPTVRERTDDWLERAELRRQKAVLPKPPRPPLISRGVRRGIGRPTTYTRPVAERIARAWAAGATADEIGASIGVSGEALRIAVKGMRQRFPDLPFERRRPFYRPVSSGAGTR